MSLSPDGLTVKTFREVVSDVQQRLTDNNTNIVITDESNKVANNIGNAICLSLSELYEFVEQVYNSFDIMSAEGTALDRLTVFKNIVRFEEEPSSGAIEFSCFGQVTVTPSVLAKDDRNRTVRCTETKTLGTGSFRQFNLVFDGSEVATAGIKYNVILNSEEFSYTAVGGDTLQDVTANIQALIAADVKYNAIIQPNLLFVVGNTIQNIETILHPIYTVQSYTTLVNFEATELGALEFLPDSITTLVSTLPNVSAITNPENFDQGRLEESDAELRERFLNTSGAVGRSTVDSIRKGITLVEGVDTVNLINNVEDAVSPEGLPPKSFEVIVSGGEIQDIADTILAYAPVGIESFGTINTTAKDSTGTIHPIAFTRPTNLYIFVNVDYEKYEEFEQFPADGETQITNSILADGSGFKPNQDVIPSAFASNIYRNVVGLGEVKITCGYSTDPTATVPDSGYSEERIEVDIRQVGIFEETRITVNNVPIP